MNPIYQPVPDFQILEVNPETEGFATSEFTNTVYMVGYSSIDFWIRLELAGGSATTKMSVYAQGLNAFGVSASGVNQALISDQPIVAGVYTANTYIGEVTVAAGSTYTRLFSFPARGLGMRLGLQFDAASVAPSNWTVYALRRP